MRPSSGLMCPKFFNQECSCAEEVEKLIKRLQTKVEIYHQHSMTCGHPRIIHDDHVDYIVDGRLHHPHITHCDDHGPITFLSGYASWLCNKCRNSSMNVDTGVVLI